MTRGLREVASLPAEVPMFRENGLALYADPRNAAELGRHNTLSGYLEEYHFGGVHGEHKAGDYDACWPTSSATRRICRH